jgi:hypothetical protein
MKKTIVFTLVISLMVTLFSMTPAKADRFWPGLAVGVGSAILLSHLLNPPRAYYYPPRAYRYDYPPVRVDVPPAYYYPSPPVYRDRWAPGHWVGNYGPHRGYSRYWVPRHRARY